MKNKGIVYVANYAASFVASAAALIYGDIIKHYGPGNHPGTGTSQDIHAPMNGRESETLDLTPSRVRNMESQLAGWDGLRGEFSQKAMTAIKNGEHGIGLVNPENGELVGIGAYLYTNERAYELLDMSTEAIGLDGDYLFIDYLATKEAGWGRSIMSKFISEASSKGVGILLVPYPDAVGFYEAIGMHTDGFVAYWTPADIKRMSVKSIADKEPQSGVFASGLRLKPINQA